MKPLLKKNVPKTSDINRQVDDWAKYRDSPVYTAVILPQIGKLIAKYDFAWAILVESCASGDMGISEGTRFMGKLKDGRILILDRPLRQDLTGVVWEKASWTQIEQLILLDRACESLPQFDDGILEGGSFDEGHFGITAVHLFSVGKNATKVIGYFGGTVRKPTAKDKRFEFLKAIGDAAYFGDPLIKVKHDLEFQTTRPGD